MRYINLRFIYLLTYLLTYLLLALIMHARQSIPLSIIISSFLILATPL